MPYLHFAIALAFSVFPLICVGAPADDAINRGRERLYALMNPAGNWEIVDKIDPSRAQANDFTSTAGPQYTGRTALVVYAMLKSGEKSVEPRLARAIEFLKSTPPPMGTYALAFRCLAYSELPHTPEIRKLAKRDSDRLLACVNARGLSTYAKGLSIPGDMSNSQVCALGLSAAQECGVEIPSRFWQATGKSWRERQTKEGAWSYAPDFVDNALYQVPHPNMTAAGVATLLLAQDAQASSDSNPQASSAEDEHITRGLAWMGQNFDKVFDFDFNGNRALYGLYMFERAGVAGGIKRFGTHVWYERAMSYLLSRQAKDGGWSGGVNGPGDTVVDTSFAIVVLSYARAPVAFNKLRYAVPERPQKQEAHWNRYSRDVARVVQWISGQTETIARWQVVGFDQPVDLLDARVLYVTGDQSLSLAREHQLALKDFVDHGGLIVFASDGRSDAFARSIQELSAKLYPDAAWRALPPEHPLMSAEQFKASTWKRPIEVMGLSNGVRELMLLIPEAEVSRRWQGSNAAMQPEAFELAANILQHAGGAGSLVQGVPEHPVPANARSTKIMRVTRKNEEPRAWSSAADWLKAEKGVTVDVTRMELARLEPSADTRLVHVSVLPGQAFTAAESEVLSAFVAIGGTVLLEAVGGEQKAVDAIGALTNQAWPTAVASDLPDEVKRLIKASDFAQMQINFPRNPVQILQAGKGRVVICQIELSSGLVGLRHSGIRGLTPDAARSLVAWLLQP